MGIKPLILTHKFYNGHLVNGGDYMSNIKLFTISEQSKNKGRKCDICEEFTALQIISLGGNVNRDIFICSECSKYLCDFLRH